MFHLISIISIVLSCLISCKGTQVITWDTCQYESMTNYLRMVQNTYPNISKLISIGQSVEGRELWVLIISDSIEERPLLRPQVKLIGNINGNAGPTCYILLKLINNLVSGFVQENSLERRVVETNEIYILPNINPDGLSKSLPGACDGNQGKYNANGIHLNRDFPDIYFPSEGRTLQPETLAIIEWIQRNNFMLSLTFMTGAMVVTYPFDSVRRDPNFPEMQIKGPHHTPDDEMFVHLATSYVNNVNEGKSTVQERWYCPKVVRTFRGGIVNGAEWMEATGTMMDYNYVEGIFELLIGISCCRNENDTEVLENIWQNNHQAILKMLTETEYGLRGQVVDSETHEPISGASMIKLPVRTNHHGSSVPMPWSTTEQGEFWRLILPGKYDLKVRADGYEEKKIPFEIKGSQFTRLIVELDRIRPTINIRPPSTRSTKDSEKHHQSHLDGFHASINDGAFYDEFEHENDKTHPEDHSLESSYSKTLKAILESSNNNSSSSRPMFLYQVLYISFLWNVM